MGTQNSILFLLKQNNTYGNNLLTAKSGLLNSARLTSKQLELNLGIKTDIGVCVDGNEINKFLCKYRPTICILEALWTTPAKLSELKALHRKVRFIVLIHSETLFLSNEGIAIKYIYDYAKIGVGIGFNSKNTKDQFFKLGINCFHLPNIYEKVSNLDNDNIQSSFVNIGCFGAIRPMKNQLIQAMGAIAYANKKGKSLKFHINASRTEQGGESVLKNIRSLFENSIHELVEHDWLDRAEFLNLISKMDIGMQLSVSESFNIVCADFVKMNVPIIVSNSIHWMPTTEKVYGESIEVIVGAISKTLSCKRKAIRKNITALNDYNLDAVKAWQMFLDRI